MRIDDDPIDTKYLARPTAFLFMLSIKIFVYMLNELFYLLDGRERRVS